VTGPRKRAAAVTSAAVLLGLLVPAGRAYTAAPVALDADPVLRQLVAQALQRRPELEQAHAVVDAGRERVPQVGALPDPSVSFGIQNDGFTSIQVGRMETSWLFLMASQTFPWFGKRGLREDVAQSQAAEVETGLTRAELTIRAEVTRAYVDLVLARDEIDLLSRLETLWTQSEGAARTRYEAGDGAQSDLLRAQLERARLKQRRALLEAEERRRVDVLDRLRGEPAGAPVATGLHLLELADPIVPSLNQSVADAEARSPELKRAALQVQESRQATDLSRRELYPDVTVTAGVMPRGGLDPMWQAGVSLNLPVWSASKQRRQIAERQALTRGASAGREAINHLLAQRVSERVRLLGAMVESNRLYRSGILIQSEATVASTLAQYRVGRVPFASVLEAVAAYVNDIEGFLTSIVATQRIVIAMDEISLDEVVPAPAGGMGSPSMSAGGGVTTRPTASAGGASAGGSGSGTEVGGSSMSRM
jgi:outer membrane protein TolC